MQLIELIKTQTSLDISTIKNIISLIEDGNTIPFIARYRKDLTKNASSEDLRIFEDLYNYNKKLLERKEEIKNILTERGFLDEKTLKNIEEALTLQNLEDIYTPFKEKKSTKTTKAIEQGLEPLANYIQSTKFEIVEVEKKAKEFLKNGVESINDAILGAKDIIAQRYADDFKNKEAIRNIILNSANLQTSKAKEFKEDGLYIKLFDIDEKIKYLKAHRIMAILRAVNEKELSVKIELDENRILENIKKFKIRPDAKSSKELVFDAFKDGLKRLLLPSLKREAITNLKEKASKESIELFGKNLKELLQTAPLVNQVILGFDPGYKNGCKLAIIDENSNYLDSAIIYPTKPKEEIENSSKKILELIKKYKISAIAIGNGTASKESASFISNLIKENKLDIKYAIVSEIGASVYSASKIAIEEYPNLDVSIKGAISIAQRLRDPMAALVKIDPKSLGIGQYQHDVNQKELEQKLENITIDLVNSVGVDLNSASKTLLSFVSGISKSVAQNIVDYRAKNGNFKTKEELLKVKGLGEKAYIQSVGFFRIKDGKNIFDNSAIHPEDYALANSIKKSLATDETLDFIEISKLHNCSQTKAKDLIFEILKPGYDVRVEFNSVKFADDILSINDIKEGFILDGVVRNITDFGAFIDIGLENDALLHISQISQKRVNHPSEVLSINQNLENLKVINIDLEKKRVSLSLKE